MDLLPRVNPFAEKEPKFFGLEGRIPPLEGRIPLLA